MAGHFVSGFLHARGDAKFRCDRVRGDSGGAKISPPKSSPPEEVQSLATLVSKKESGGHADAVNRFGYAGLYQFGASRLSELQVYTPGPNESLERWSWSAGGKWQGSFHIPGHPEVSDIRDFLKSVPAQKAVFRIHLATIQHEIAQAGLSKYLGSTIRKVPITMEGIEIMIHLGGVGGARRVLATDGGRNPSDANGTSLLDYARVGATISQANGGLVGP